MVLQDKIRGRRLLMLGGIEEQIIAIERAKAMGLYVITCDYRPDNPGHRLADEYHNVSITDRDAVLALAREVKADGVVCYALEAGVEAAAWAQEQMGRLANPYESVRILSNKRLFRDFLRSNGFNVPRTFAPGDEIAYPVIVKPTDMWGSRGVTKVCCAEDLSAAMEYARKHSRSGEVIIEEYIAACGAPFGLEAFAIDGRIAAAFWYDQVLDDQAANPHVPVAEIYPSKKDEAVKATVLIDLQRLITLLRMRTGAYNIEVREAADGRVFLMEVAPRSGGNKIPVVALKATGCDMISAQILAALGEDCHEAVVMQPIQGVWTTVVEHDDAMSCSGDSKGVRIIHDNVISV